MKVVMINDCAFVGETLLKYMPPEMEKQHIKRSRGLWSKTFGLTFKIMHAKGDVYHAHYLLQDCYIASRLGKKPLVGHAHGSDLRASLNHSAWGRIVRHNLKHCSRVLVSTPDVLSIAKRYREDAEYLPNPIDAELFYQKPPLQKTDRKRVLIASDANWKVKGTDIAIRALSKIKDEVDVSIVQHGRDFEKTAALAASLGLSLKVLPKIPHEKLNEYYWNSDVVIDRFALGSLGLISLEAIACGRPALVYASSEFPENEDFPLKDLKQEDAIAETIRELPVDLWEKQYGFIKKHHNTESIEARLRSIYSELTAR
ncbi:MAG: glycosyltransferase [Candidatus Bathyarchaeota archaeon]|nr:glycosyltransferase [Candidatus Bathyarchaeota archaeon]